MMALADASVNDPPPFQRMKAVAGLRFVPADLRKRLEQEAKRRDKSFSSEVQARLRRSFEDEKTLWILIWE